MAAGGALRGRGLQTLGQGSGRAEQMRAGACLPFTAVGPCRLNLDRPPPFPSLPTHVPCYSILLCLQGQATYTHHCTLNPTPKNPQPARRRYENFRFEGQQFDVPLHRIVDSALLGQLAGAAAKSGSSKKLSNGWVGGGVECWGVDGVVQEQAKEEALEEE
jgi:hypothetical protein